MSPRLAGMVRRSWDARREALFSRRPHHTSGEAAEWKLRQSSSDATSPRNLRGADRVVLIGLGDLIGLSFPPHEWDLLPVASAPGGGGGGVGGVMKLPGINGPVDEKRPSDW